MTPTRTTTIAIRSGRIFSAATPNASSWKTTLSRMTGPDLRMMPVAPFRLIGIATSTSTSSTRLYAAKKAISSTVGGVASINLLISKMKSMALSLITNTWNYILSATVIALKALQELSTVQKTLFVGIFLVGFACGKLSSIRPFWIPYRDVNDIPSSYFSADANNRQTPLLRGRAITVSDGDTIRFLHTPLPWQYDKDKKYKVSETCLPIRCCTYDTPETPKFGSKGQPFGIEAKDELTNLLKDQIVHLKLLQKDQYNRVVACMWIHDKKFGGLLSMLLPWTKKKVYVDEHMLSKGLAEVYTGGGAVYGPYGKDYYMKLQSDAQSQKIGIWSLKNRESAAEYKKRTKENK